MPYFGHASRDEEGRDDSPAPEREVRVEINKQCERLGLNAHLSGPPTFSTHVWEVDKILLYLLCKADCNLDLYDETRIMALINPAQHERLKGVIKRYEDREAAKAVAG